VVEPIEADRPDEARTRASAAAAGAGRPAGRSSIAIVTSKSGFSLGDGWKRPRISAASSSATARISSKPAFRPSCDAAVCRRYSAAAAKAAAMAPADAPPMSRSRYFAAISAMACG